MLLRLLASASSTVLLSRLSILLSAFSRPTTTMTTLLYLVVAEDYSTELCFNSSNRKKKGKLRLGPYHSEMLLFMKNIMQEGLLEFKVLMLLCIQVNGLGQESLYILNTKQAFKPTNISITALQLSSIFISYY